VEKSCIYYTQYDGNFPLIKTVIRQKPKKMKIIYTLIILWIGYAVYNKKKKGLREASLTGKIFSRTFNVSINHPLDERQTMELISINEDGSATIRTLYSDETLTAKPSEYFIGKDFGSFGLRLISVSQERQTIELKHTVPEDC
jgi:hypothetical protein